MYIHGSINKIFGDFITPYIFYYLTLWGPFSACPTTFPFSSIMLHTLFILFFNTSCHINVNKLYFGECTELILYILTAFPKKAIQPPTLTFLYPLIFAPNKAMPINTVSICNIMEIVFFYSYSRARI